MSEVEQQRKIHKNIWVVSYPKSGNTWMRLLLREYFIKVNGGPPFETSDVSPYFYQVVSAKAMHMLIPEEFIQLRPAAMMHLTTVSGGSMAKESVGVIKSHMPSGDLYGVPFFSPFWVDCAIYIVRDPRDVLPSMADHMGKSLQETVDLMANSKAQIGGGMDPPKVPTLLASWSEHVLSWIGREKRVSTIVTSYERMQEDTAQELRRVLEFCGYEPNEEAIQYAVEQCEFKKLQEREAQQGFVEKSKKHEKFFRRGIVGSHKDEVPNDLVGQIERHHGAVMNMVGYKFD